MLEKKKKKKGPLINSKDTEKDRCFPGWVVLNKKLKKSRVTLGCRLRVGSGGKAGASRRRRLAGAI